MDQAQKQPREVAPPGPLPWHTAFQSGPQRDARRGPRERQSRRGFGKVWSDSGWDAHFVRCVQSVPRTSGMGRRAGRTTWDVLFILREVAAMQCVSLSHPSYLSRFLGLFLILTLEPLTQTFWKSQLFCFPSLPHPSPEATQMGSDDYLSELG